MYTHRRAAAAAATAVLMSAPSAVADEWIRDSAGNMMAPPTPEVSAKLFDPIEEAKDPACPTRDEVIRHYISATSSL